MKLFTPLIAIACIASTVSAEAIANDNCQADCLAQVTACHSRNGYTFGSIPRDARTRIIAGETIGETIRIVVTDIRTDIMVYCNTHFADCLAICNGKPGNIPPSGWHDYQQMDMPNGLTGLGFRLTTKSDNWWMHCY